MNEMNAAPLFPQALVFPDVDAAILAQEEDSMTVGQDLASSGAWQLYLSRTLSPLRGAQALQAAS